MSSPVYTVKIAGPAGAGIKSSGLLLSQLFLAHGFNLRDYSEYPSLVRGGHNTYQVSFSLDEIFAPHFNVDLFFSLLPNHWQQHESEFSENTLVFGDDTKNILPLKDLSAAAGGAIYTNTICLGVATYLLNLDLEACKKIISQQFGNESPNNQAFLSGYEYATTNFKNLQKTDKYQLKPNNSVLYDGNESFGWGFIQGGGNFYAAYPMTPASGALHFLAAKQAEYKFQVIHPEDEIAAASLAAGATFGGARAATGTSGGGFALMTETVSLCGAAELGTLFYLVSRPGPATGLPTWTSQADLLFAVNAGHGEFNKIVLAPGNQAESFEMAATALNLAAEHSVPVIVVSDKFIAESGASQPDLSLQKVKITKSTKPAPGTPNAEYMANSYEHDEQGFSIEDIPSIKKSVEKRLVQHQEILKSVPKPTFYGQDTAKKLIISWGSPASTILETLRLLNNPDYAFLQIKTLWPIDPNIKSLIDPFKEVIVVENNATAQLVSLLKSQFDFNPTKTILKYDGRPFFPEELIKQL
jgi:2-oxoglutarate/2-oxoacid ferredoxin oxidoreductase subunit alpha